jgi:hypothetical protein
VNIKRIITKDLANEILKKEELFRNGCLKVRHAQSVQDKKKYQDITASDLLVKSETPLIQDVVKLRELDLEDYEPKYIKALQKLHFDETTSGTAEEERVVYPVDVMPEEDEISEEESPSWIESLQDLARGFLWKMYLLNSQHSDGTAVHLDRSIARHSLSLQDRILMKRITRRLKAILESQDISDERKEEAVNNFMRHSLAFSL